jgi:hypothetical protein
MSRSNPMIPETMAQAVAIAKRVNASWPRPDALPATPEPRCPILPNVRPFVLGLEQRRATRAEMIAIATELEGSDG